MTPPYPQNACYGSFRQNLRYERHQTFFWYITAAGTAGGTAAGNELRTVHSTVDHIFDNLSPKNTLKSVFCIFEKAQNPREKKRRRT